MVGVFSTWAPGDGWAGAIDFLFCFSDERRDLSLDLRKASVDWNMATTGAGGEIGWRSEEHFVLRRGIPS